MKKVFLSLLAVFAIVMGVSAQGSIITDWSEANGSSLDTATTDSFYLKIDNPLLDSVVVFYNQNASTDNPSVSCTLMSTIHDIAANGTMQVEANARKATWTTVCEVFASLSTENSMQFYPLTEANLMAAPGIYYMLRFTGGATANHDETSRILNVGTLQFRKPD